MQVWATASARAPIVVGVLVARIASSTTPSHRRTGLGPGSLRAAGAVATAVRRGTTRASASPRTGRLVRHEDMAEDELAAEAALPGGDGGGRAHRVVLVPERCGEVDVEAVAAGVDGLLEPAVADGGGGDGQEVVLGVLDHGAADLGDRAHLAGGPDLAGLLVDRVVVDPGGVHEHGERAGGVAAGGQRPHATAHHLR